MILAAHQPYFSPFAGFFYKAHLADVLVLLDDVQFPQGTTWISRNRFKNAGGTLWMTIPVLKKGLGLQKIGEVRILRDKRWQRKHLESLRAAYAKSPYFVEHAQFLEELFSDPCERLLDFNLAIIRRLMGCLPLVADMRLLSQLGIESRGTRLLVEICETLGATRFLVQNPAARYLEIHLFEEAGIEIECFKYPSPVYPQLWGDFIPNLSLWDMVFNCGPKAWDIINRCR